MHGQSAIIGWGSLISFPGSLLLSTRWHNDGPLLPVEFARISSGERLTLVIHPGSAALSTLWAASAAANLEAARQDLRGRERTAIEFIHCATAGGSCSGGVEPEIENAVRVWMRNHPAISACVWTGLLSNWRDKQQCDLSPDAVICFLNGIKDPTAARTYFQNTPNQIQTEVRAAVRNRLGWQDAELPGTLFENVQAEAAKESRNR